MRGQRQLHFNEMFNRYCSQTAKQERVLAMAIDLILSPDPYSRDPLEQARRSLLKALAALKVPYIPTWPDAGTFDDVRDMVREVKTLTNAWLRAVGDEMETNSPHSLRKELFDGAFSDVMDEAASECERQAELLREDLAA